MQKIRRSTLKTISILLALVNSLGAGVVIAASLPAIQVLRPASAIWNATKVTFSLGIILAGILTWVAAARLTNRGLIFVAGLFLVSLGTASAVWTVHLALGSGNIKDHMLLYAGSLVAQGASSLWALLGAGKGSAGI
jgi:hypothetical protein